MKSNNSMKTILATSLLSTILLSSSASYAAGDSGFLFDISLMPAMGIKTDTDSTPTSKVEPESYSGADAKVTTGYIFSPQVFVGFTYNYTSLNSARAAVTDGSESLDEKIAKTEMGPTIGYFMGGWRFLATYLMSGKQTKDVVNKGADGVISGKNSFTYSDLSGFEVAVGYTYAFNKNFAIGPTLVYRNASYATQEKVNALQSSETYGPTKLTTAKSESSLSPQLAFEFRF